MNVLWDQFSCLSLFHILLIRVLFSVSRWIVERERVLVRRQNSAPLISVGGAIIAVPLRPHLLLDGLTSESPLLSTLTVFCGQYRGHWNQSSLPSNLPAFCGQSRSVQNFTGLFPNPCAKFLEVLKIFHFLFQDPSLCFATSKYPLQSASSFSILPGFALPDYLTYVLSPWKS